MRGETVWTVMQKGKKSTNNQIGRMGEDAVCQYLMECGHGILERNWRTGYLEIDIISLDKNGIHFVEVKSRVAPVMAEPEENVGWVKQKRVARAALRYLSEQKSKGFHDMEVHMDVAAVVFSGGKVSISYFGDAYIPIYI